MTPAHVRAVVVAALACGVAVIALVLTSDHEEDKGVWAVFGPAVMWSFVGTGLYAWRRRPESRTGALMVLLGFAWFVAGLGFADSRLLYTVAQLADGLWGAVFLHLVMAFPSGRLAARADRRIVQAGYLLFTLASLPALLVAGPEDLGCARCPTSLVLVRRDEDLADAALAIELGLYVVLFVVVLVRLAKRWLRTPPLERVQLTPVYLCGLATFLLATVGIAVAGEPASWAAFIATAMLPLAFLGGLLRSHVADLDAQLRARLEELRASRARLVEAGDNERRRLERDLHDGAQSRLVAVAVLLGQVRRRIAGDAQAAALLDRAQAELKTGLAELRELARGIHPAVLTERGLEPALDALAARAPVPVTVKADGDERLPAPVEIAAYFVVSEALANVAKYAHATEATVAVRRNGASVTVEVADDGVGGADAAAGSGLRGLADRVAAL
ncbi:MAG TPA: histidine kinase, partial [Solirubrobacteraceae bacterium]|nr:histidine kinase [Solirubrobacteraceae bacterium]